MKKIVLILFAGIMVVSNCFPVSAASKRVTEGDFTAEINEDGTSVTIQKYLGSDAVVAFPDEIEQMPVTGIGFWTFWGDDIYELTIPKNVVEINKNMFESGAGLEEFIVDEENPRFYTIDGVLFDHEKNELYLFPKGKMSDVYELPEEITGIGSGAFCDCSNIKEMVIPENCLTIEDLAFADCKELQKITIAEGLQSIGEKAFANCIHLEDFTIPASVNEIGEQAFANLKTVTEFTVVSENEVYASVDGVLISKSDGTLLAYPVADEAAEYEIPENITKLGTSSFRFCDHLERVAIPEGVQSIGQEAFYWCSNLKEVKIPESVTAIGPDAFTGCPDLVLSVVEGSYAQQYAQENQITATVVE